MQVHHTDTERNLNLTVESLKQTSPNMRCVHFRLSTMNEKWQEHTTRIVDILKEEMLGLSANCYVCEDSDIYLMDAMLNNRFLQKILARLTKELQIPAIQEFVALYEIGFDHAKIKATIDRKIILINERKRQALIQIQEKRRQEVLATQIPQEEINKILQRRKDHKTIQVMVVEDDVFTHRLISKTIGELAEVNFCTDAYQAITKYTSLSPDIVFLDIGLPDVTGHDVVTKLLQIDSNAHIVMLSGNCDVNNVKQALSNGAKGFAVKPFAKAKIWEYISRSPHVINKQK